MLPAVTLIDKASETIGRLTGWVALALVLVQALVVLLRYVFGLGFTWMQESILYFHAMLFLLGGGYCLLHDGHVRVDVLLERLPVRQRALVNALAALFLIFPFCLLIGFYSWDYVLASWSILEGSRQSGGLPLVFILKSLIFAFVILLGLQGLSLLLKSHRIWRAG